METSVIRAVAPPPGDRRVEIVERKGVGHPDSICDALAEELSLALSRFYLERAGGILHHNVDKALLVAGRSEPRFGGGRVVEPMHVFLAGRAALEVGTETVPIEELAETSARRWLAGHLHALDAQRHVAISALVRPGSSELVGLFDERRARRRVPANDTSCGVGYAPLSDVERVVLAVEGSLREAAARGEQPAFGEDVKVMAVRRGERVHLTVACAMIGSRLADLTEYAKARERAAEIALEAAARATPLRVAVHVNAADDVESGRVYLTVTGTSAEAGDDGQAGRGNRVNGLIAPGRPMTMESVAGKNPVSHVGKLYNLAASLAAERLVAELEPVRAAECCLVSRIGHPIDEPDLVQVAIAGADPEADRDLAGAVERIVHRELERLPRLTEELVRGGLGIDRWPLRAREPSE
jgi:S-adenosylmethionine synthetase